MHFLLWRKGYHESTNFDFFKCSDENLPNSSCNFPNHKSVFLQILHLSDLQINVCYLRKVRMKIILNNNLEFKMKDLEGRSVLLENFMNGHFKSEWTKIVLCFFLTKANIWKFSRIMHMNSSPEFLITVV